MQAEIKILKCWNLLWLLLLNTFSYGAYDFVLRPEFGERITDLNVTAFVGQTSRLPCTVKHLAGKQVSWIRSHDLQVLSTGRTTFSNDLRISVLPGTRPKSRHYREILSGTCLMGAGMSCRPSRVTPYAPVTFRSKKARRKRAPEENRLPSRSRRRRWRRPRELRRDGTIQVDRPSAGAPPAAAAPASVVVSRPRSPASEDPGLQSYSQYQKAISIYPQSSFLNGKDDAPRGSKRLQPGRSYINGIWEPEDYTLQIKYTRLDDAGTYMCQINTEPRISQTVVLRVFKMKAEILGNQELFVKTGNPVTLSCRVSHGSLTPEFTLWYKEERLVEYESSGGRIRVMTMPDGVSHLVLEDTKLSDSANYTCSPAGGIPDSVILNVIEDERQAAMQQSNMGAELASSPASALFPFLLVFMVSTPPYETLISLLLTWPATSSQVNAIPLLKSTKNVVCLSVFFVRSVLCGVVLR